jgi:hypothetical protein
VGTEHNGGLKLLIKGICRIGNVEIRVFLIGKKVGKVEP